MHNEERSDSLIKVPAGSKGPFFKFTKFLEFIPGSMNGFLCLYLLVLETTLDVVPLEEVPSSCVVLVGFPL